MAERVQFAPAGRLASFVRRTVVTERRMRGDPYTRIPNGEVDLVVRFTGADVLIHVLGAPTTAMAKAFDVDVSAAIGMRFKAGGAYPFFGVPISELADRAIPLDELWGVEATALGEALARAPDHATAVQSLEDSLLAHLGRAELFEPASAAIARRGVRLIRESSEPVRVDDIARTLGVSARNLRRAFHDVVGMGPKAFARVVRFQRALRAARSVALPDWGAIANDTGYYDQSHLIADFRALAGVTPAVFVHSRQAVGLPTSPA
jgi:AraC-like DNA-binding protein